MGWVEETACANGTDSQYMEAKEGTVDGHPLATVAHHIVVVHDDKRPLNTAYF